MKFSKMFLSACLLASPVVQNNYGFEMINPLFWAKLCDTFAKVKWESNSLIRRTFGLEKRSPKDQKEFREKAVSVLMATMLGFYVLDAAKPEEELTFNKFKAFWSAERSKKIDLIFSTSAMLFVGTTVLKILFGSGPKSRDDGAVCVEMNPVPVAVAIAN